MVDESNKDTHHEITTFQRNPQPKLAATLSMKTSELGIV